MLQHFRFGGDGSGGYFNIQPLEQSGKEMCNKSTVLLF
jgi:hypothetical protein